MNAVVVAVGLDRAVAVHFPLLRLGRKSNTTPGPRQSTGKWKEMGRQRNTTQRHDNRQVKHNFMCDCRHMQLLTYQMYNDQHLKGIQVKAANEAIQTSVI